MTGLTVPRANDDEGSRHTMHEQQNNPVPDGPYGTDVEKVLVTEADLQRRVAEMAVKVSAEHADDEQDLILIGVLKGAVFFMTDFARALTIPSQMEFMAVSSYGNASSSSGVVRILKDLDRNIAGRNVLIVEDIIDSGLTLSWLMRNLRTRNPRSIEIVTLLRKPDAVKADLDILEIGFDIPNEFVVGYGLDFSERYRDLPYIGKLHPRMYS